MKKIIPLFLAIFLAGVSIAQAHKSATTWFPKEFTCPIDNEKNTFLVVGSYGSYIYSWESKYQWLFFPQTDSPAYYICKKCNLTTYMWDFDKIPKEKIPAIKEVLAKLTPKKFKEYTDLSVAERLEIMEKVYAVLDKDEDWWESFYRVKGYHYGAEQPEKAMEARKKSLEMLTKFIINKKGENPLKLLYYISAAMKHFTKDDKGAIEDLEKALTVKYEEKNAASEKLQSAEEGLNERIKDYIERIKGDKKPRLAEGKDSH